MSKKRRVYYSKRLKEEIREDIISLLAREEEKKEKLLLNLGLRAESGSALISLSEVETDINEVLESYLE